MNQQHLHRDGADQVVVPEVGRPTYVRGLVGMNRPSAQRFLHSAALTAEKLSEGARGGRG
jgi:hypothetical protein